MNSTVAAPRWKLLLLVINKVLYKIKYETDISLYIIKIFLLIKDFFRIVLKLNP